MALVDVPDDLLALVAQVAASEDRTAELQAVRLIREALQARDIAQRADRKRTSAAGRQRRKRERDMGCDMGVTEVRDVPLSPPNGSPHPSLTTSISHESSSAHAHAREGVPFEAGPMETPLDADQAEHVADTVRPPLPSPVVSAPPGPPPTGEGAARPVRAAPKPTFKYPSDFETKFWEPYPLKVGKAKAAELWKRHVAAGVDPDDILAGLQRWLASGKWAEEGGRFICHPSTFLGTERRWEDYPPAARPVLAAVPDLPPPPVVPASIVGRPWLDSYRPFIGPNGPSQASVMNWASSLGVDPYEAARHLTGGLASTGDWVWSQRRPA